MPPFKWKTDSSNPSIHSISFQVVHFDSLKQYYKINICKENHGPALRINSFAFFFSIAVSFCLLLFYNFVIQLSVAVCMTASSPVSLVKPLLQMPPFAFAIVFTFAMPSPTFFSSFVGGARKNVNKGA